MLSGMSGLPSGGHTGRAMLPLVSLACVMHPLLHTCEAFVSPPLCIYDALLLLICLNSNPGAHVHVAQGQVQTSGNFTVSGEGEET